MSTSTSTERFGVSGKVTNPISAVKSAFVASTGRQLVSTALTDAAVVYSGG